MIYILFILSFLFDVIIHKRIPVFKNPSNRYIKAIIQAHTAHHKPATPQDFKNYGLLIFPRRFFN